MNVDRRDADDATLLILSIDNVEVEDSGPLECHASNTHGRNSTIFMLHVQGERELPIHMKPNYTMLSSLTLGLMGNLGY